MLVETETCRLPINSPVLLKEANGNQSLRHFCLANPVLFDKLSQGFDALLFGAFQLVTKEKLPRLL